MGIRFTSFWVVLVAGSLAGCSLYFGDDGPEEQPPPLVDPPVALPRCAPAPVMPGSALAPDLHAWILEHEGASCALERRTSGGAAYGFPTTEDRFAAPGRERCDADGCWRSLPAFARAWSATPPLDQWSYRPQPLGEQWTGMVSAERNVATGELRATLAAMVWGMGGVHRVERRWDAAGQLRFERTWFDDRPRGTVELTWLDGHPASAHHVDLIDTAGTTEHTWRWDGDRLVASEVVNSQSGTRAAAQLDYDAAGHLRSIDRTVDDQPWTRQTWRYAGDRVTAATTDVDSAVTRAVAQTALATDDLVPVTTVSVQSQWDVAAGLVATAAGCAPLPHGLQYGYPEADGAYALGYTVDDRPGGIDTDYGFGNVYDTGHDRWFGHDRVEAYTYLEPWGNAVVASQHTYDAEGRMISEHLATADGAINATRTRLFAGPRLVSDQRLLVRDGLTSSTALAFAHDDAGRVVTRTYTVGGRLAGVHTWIHDGGLIALHTIASPAVPFPDPGRTFEIPDLAAVPRELAPPIVHERVGDATLEQWLRDGELVGSHRRDAAGRTLERMAGVSFERFAYDDAGRLAAYASGYGAITAENLAYQRDPAGDLRVRSWSYSDISTDADVFHYTCGP